VHQKFHKVRKNEDAKKLHKFISVYNCKHGEYLLMLSLRIAMFEKYILPKSFKNQWITFNKKHKSTSKSQCFM